MPTLVEDPVLQTVEETYVEGFDLEWLARISEAPPIEPPRFALLQPARSFHVRRWMVAAVLSAAIVGGLATLGPAANAVLADSGVCAVAE